MNDDRMNTSGADWQATLTAASDYTYDAVADGIILC
jgi:hypothetical protein